MKFYTAQLLTQTTPQPSVTTTRGMGMPTAGGSVLLIGAESIEEALHKGLAWCTSHNGNRETYSIVNIAQYYSEFREIVT